MASFDRLALRQLDDVLTAFNPAAAATKPRGGWARAVRKGLGMSARQLGARLGITQQAVAELERAEKTGNITLHSLERLANALECRVVYGFVPRNGSLEETLRRRAETKARQLVDRVSVSMAIERQGVDDPTQEKQVKELANRLLEELPRSLWDDWAG